MCLHICYCVTAGAPANIVIQSLFWVPLDASLADA